MDYLEDLKLAAQFDCHDSDTMIVSQIGIAFSGLVLLIIIIICTFSPSDSLSDYTNWIIISSVCLGISIVGFLFCPVKAVYDSKKMNKEVKNTN